MYEIKNLIFKIAISVTVGYLFMDPEGLAEIELHDLEKIRVPVPVRPRS
jgi:hypothetical protein